MRRIDFETHYVTQKFKDATTAVLGGPGPGGDEAPCDDYTPEERIAMMDRYGITTQIISGAGGFENFSRETALDVSQDSNDFYYDLTQKYPGRFLAYALLSPTQDVDAALLEMERCKKMGFVGWMTQSNYTTTFLDDEQYFPLLQKAEKLGMFVYLHPNMSTIPRLQNAGFMLNTGLGFHLDCCITISRMIVKGIFDRLPNLKVVMGHLGEAMPFMIERMDSMFYNLKHSRQTEAQRKNNIEKNEHPIGYYFDNNIYVTTSGTFSKAAFLCVKERMGIDRILFGSDTPVEKYDKALNYIDSLGLTEIEKEKLFYVNAEKHFGIC